MVLIYIRPYSRRGRSLPAIRLLSRLGLYTAPGALSGASINGIRLYAKYFLSALKCKKSIRFTGYFVSVLMVFSIFSCLLALGLLSLNAGGFFLRVSTLLAFHCRLSNLLIVSAILGGKKLRLGSCVTVLTSLIAFGSRRRSWVGLHERRNRAGFCGAYIRIILHRTMYGIKILLI